MQPLTKDAIAARAEANALEYAAIRDDIPKWEYQLLVVSSGANWVADSFREGEDICRSVAACANLLGREGWELDRIERDTDDKTYWFKRRLLETPAERAARMAAYDEALHRAYEPDK